MVNLKCRGTSRLVAAILCGFCVLLFCQCTKKNNAKSAEIHLLLNRHPFTESILRFIPEYERKTGVKVNTLLLSEEEYFEIIADKTASLFSVSCETGPILARRDNRERQRYARFGEEIGTAFQIADDLLDFVGDPKITGKEPGIDVMNGHVTLPLIYTLKKANEASRREIIGVLKEGNHEESFGRIHTYVEESGGLDYASRRASELSEQALESIVSIGRSVYYDSLVNIVRFAVARAS